MKYIIAILALFTAINVNAQSTGATAQDTTNQAINLEIAWHKTTLLIFPAPVSSADRGDKYILADTVREASNMLKVKAGEKDFLQSNLNVVTRDGKVYTFNVSYKEDAPCLPINVSQLPQFNQAKFKGLSLNAREIEKFSGIVTAVHPFFKKGKYKKYGMKLMLEGLYIKDDVLFVRYNLKNTTSIRYNDASMRFYVRDKKKAKRTAEQDKESSPVYVQRTGLPEDPQGQTIVAVFPKFTIAEDKYFAVEFMEQNGDRNPVSKLDQSLVLRSKVLR